jgi:hypothetical protein
MPVLDITQFKRQKALNSGNFQEFKRLRNCVNRERRKCRSKCYEAKVNHLKSCKSSDWWREVKKLNEMNSAFKSKNEVYKSLENLNETATSTKHLVNIINGMFLSLMNDLFPLASDFFACTDFGSDEPSFTVTEQEVPMKLSKVNPAKANGPDGIPSWVLKENADLLADPVKEILNLSYRESYLPQSWKEADIVPLPKQKPVKDVNKHLQPISTYNLQGFRCFSLGLALGRVVTNSIRN